MSRCIMIIDDERAILESLSAALKDEGFRVLLAKNGKDGIECIKGEKPDLVLLDIWMAEFDGLETLKEIKANWPELMVIMMSGHGNIETAVKATKLGAYDFVEKPLSLERILVLLQNALSTQALARENQMLRQQIQKSKILVGDSEAMKEVQNLIQSVAPTTGSVLISGENGTGKELVAHAIHTLSPRFNRGFVEVNCAAIPEELIESELFGHERGAFTGATHLKRGKFDLAHCGTLFLDEIADMSLKTQAKILRILQEQKFERVGGSQTLSVDVRIVAATNKDLKTEISKGNFREDLYYRLNVIPFHIPPLRERKDDISLLARHFIKEFSAAHGRQTRELTNEALEVLLAYSWPGNVRELRNLVERLVILTSAKLEGNPIMASDILQNLKDEVESLKIKLEPQTTAVNAAMKNFVTLKDARQEFERDFILKTLKEQEWNVSKTAQVLGVERSHLHRKIKSYGLEYQ